MAPVNPRQFLEDARPFPGQNRFILGTFERGVTLYRQQVRALNLVYALVESKTTEGKPAIPHGSRIAVIGGGAFGMTVAAAAAYAGFRAVLLERQQNLLDLQRGCDTRWVHPHFYDWPAPQSESRLARLPMLNWAASTAGQVATQIEHQFRELMNERPDTLECIVEVSSVAVSAAQDGVHEVRCRSKSGQNIWPCAAVIYAVGFGTEKAARESYWRNDRLGQSDLEFTGGEKIRYVVSGVGDGGLVDVFRLTIRDFRHDLIFSEMFGRPDNPILPVIDALQSYDALKSGWIFDQFQKLESGEHSKSLLDAMEMLKARLRSDTTVTLNGTESSFRSSVSLGRISLSNALLAYCLFRIGAVSYESGVLDLKDPEKPRIKKAKGKAAVPPWLKGAKLVIRHGTDREDALRGVGCSDAIAFLKKQRDIRDSGQAIFPAGWWGRYTAPADAANDPGREPTRVEFVPPALMSHAATFVSTLGNVLGVLIEKKLKDRSREPNFRVTLHRLVRFDGHDVYQQLTPYAGQVGNTAGLGRYFRVESGIVGLACRSGSLVVVRRTDDERFRKIWELTSLDRGGAKAIKPYVNSLLACPFFAPAGDNQEQHVLLTLFVDSVEPDFFDSEVRDIISAACRGFVDLLEDLLRRRALRLVPSYYPGFKVERGPELDKLVEQLKVLGVEFTDAKHQGWKDGLTFKSLSSLDLEVGPFMKLAQ